MTGCYAKGCKNSSSKGAKMNFFPKNPERRALWISNCKTYKATTYKPPNDFSALCEYHFAPNMWEKPRVDGKKKLKSDAVPSIFGDSVFQIEKTEKKNIPEKNKYLSNGIMVHTNPHTKGIQILTYPDQKCQLLLVNGLTSNAMKPTITANTPNDSCTKDVNAIATSTKKNTSLLFNTNINSCSKNSIYTNVSRPNSEKIVHNIEENDDSNNFISNAKIIDEEDSDTDSFIDKNFEPITDDEIDANDIDYENFEPITDDEVDSKEEIETEVEEQTTKAQITSGETRLYLLLTQLRTSSNKTDVKCSRCDKLEKVYQNSERLRVMMKRNYKQTYKNLKKKIQSLVNHIKVLKDNTKGLQKILNQDQIDFLCKNKKKPYKWSDSTLEKAYKYRLALGHKRYQLLIKEKWPLPSLRTLRSKQDAKKKL